MRPNWKPIQSWSVLLTNPTQKPNVVQRYKNEMGCTTHGDYPTEMDDAEEWDGFSCEIWSDCLEGNEFVSCVGNFEHGWPYTHTHPETGINVTRILWDFMKRHRREGNWVMSSCILSSYRDSRCEIQGILNHHMTTGGCSKNENFPGRSALLREECTNLCTNHELYIKKITLDIA